ncbi:hypothetical protein DFA_03171 [Cavenderia fasciculata]|uniref:Uncharacterized protein n=1 Tax=Cavenderia fasciculata TaxID=261658 RepID=F4PGU2_CACFS|nr:uncharacterized protein DFA_03171 [Cavenderia fasciculata]EGG24926.1 hypothetical protein DFA_03171 [Cavenderia fasciculata]|eukprot:XP_004362777.1 hypothetical protein DFA_03171 [Cavenderia fasciculata]
MFDFALLFIRLQFENFWNQEWKFSKTGCAPISMSISIST